MQGQIGCLIGVVPTKEASGNFNVTSRLSKAQQHMIRKARMLVAYGGEWL